MAHKLGTVNKCAVALISVIHMAGISSMYDFVHRSGYLDSLRRLRDEGPHLLPGPDNPILTWYSGFITDPLVTASTVVFAPVTDGSTPRLSLYGLHFAGQLVGIYIVLVIEGARLGNQKNPIYFTMLWGFAMQILSYAFSMPVYTVVQLLVSEAAGIWGSDLARAVKVDILALQTLPLAIWIGYVVPLFLMAIPLPKQYNLLHQWFSGLWQGFPLYVSIIQLALRPWYQTKSLHDKARKSREIVALHKAYRLGLLFCLVTHLACYFIIVINTLLPYSLNALFGDAQDITFVNVFVPPWPYSYRPANLAEGIHYILHYDQYFGSVAALVWAITLNLNSRKEGSSFRNWITLLRATFIVSAISGPAGAVLWSLWERDDRLLKDAEVLAPQKVKPGGDGIKRDDSLSK